MSMLLTALIKKIDAAATASGLKDFRIAYKKNARGEFVIALLVRDQILARLDSSGQRSDK